MSLERWALISSPTAKVCASEQNASLLAIFQRRRERNVFVFVFINSQQPFEKTATQKIRRFKYKESAPTVEQEKKNNYDKKEKKD